MIKSRRNFVKALTAAPVLGALGGCTHFDRLFLGDSRDDRDKVVILGGGLAGLSAAYTLRKAQMPFRIYEGRKKNGGRLLTLSDFNVSAQTADLGGEWIRSSHKVIFDLAKELGVTIDEFKSDEDFVWLRSGTALALPAQQKAWLACRTVFSKLAEHCYGHPAHRLTAENISQFPKAEQLDLITAAELLERLKSQVDPVMIQFLQQLCRFEFGAEPEQISALHLIHWFQAYGQDRRWYKISGGSQVLSQALFDRVAGVIPERFTRFEHRLVRIKESSDYWNLTFETPHGEEEVMAKQVICALPFSCLRQIEGYDQLPLPAWQKQLIKNLGYGSHSKLAMDFSDRFWSKNQRLSKSVHWIFEEQQMWISDVIARPQVELTQGRGLLTATFGGEMGKKSGEHDLEKALAALALLQKNPLPFENIFHIQNWSLNPWSLGSVSYCKPGQFSLKSEAFKTNPDSVGNWVTAGEHTSLLWMGSMNGAVESGLKAAQVFVKS